MFRAGGDRRWGGGDPPPGGAPVADVGELSAEDLQHRVAALRLVAPHRHVGVQEHSWCIHLGQLVEVPAGVGDPEAIQQLADWLDRPRLIGRRAGGVVFQQQQLDRVAGDGRLAVNVARAGPPGRLARVEAAHTQRACPPVGVDPERLEIAAAVDHGGDSPSSVAVDGGRLAGRQRRHREKRTFLRAGEDDPVASGTRSVHGFADLEARHEDRQPASSCGQLGAAALAGQPGDLVERRGSPGDPDTGACLGAHDDIASALRRTTSTVFANCSAGLNSTSSVSGWNTGVWPGRAT